MEPLIQFKDIENNAWEILSDENIFNEAGEMIAKKLIVRNDNKYYHISLIKRYFGDSFYWHPMIFEHYDGKDKVGDVIITLRKDPMTGIWYIDISKEVAYIVETQTVEIKRAQRASLDNRDQVLQKTVIYLKKGFSNPQRVAGEIKEHYLIENWSPQLKAKGLSIPITEYLEQPDMIGKAALLDTISHLLKGDKEDKKTAREIIEQMSS